MNSHQFFQVTISLLVLVPTHAQTQAMAPPIDRTKLERPFPVVTAEFSDIEKFYSSVRAKIEGAGFRVQREDSRNGVIEASKPDPGSTGGEDRIVVWIERDLQQPLSKVQVYVLFGHYEQVLTGTGKNLLRVAGYALPEAFIEQRIGDLRRSLLAMSKPAEKER